MKLEFAFDKAFILELGFKKTEVNLKVITVVGMGQERGDLTLKGKRAIASAEVLVARTVISPASKQLKNKIDVSFDDLYVKADDFAVLNDLIVKALLEMENDGKNIVYCVDGDGYSDESVIRLSKETGINIIGGVADWGARNAASEIYFTTAYALLSETPVINTRIPLNVSGLDNKLLAGELKLFLLEYYPPQTRVSFIQGTNKLSFELADLDRQKKYGSPCSLFIDAETNFDKEKYCFNDLIKVLERLTAPNGCEWDKVQTHESIRINLIEEAYEAVDAIDSGDINAMIEELGDVLLQAVLHADIAKRHKEFNLEDVVDALCKKLVSRHTHIFGTDSAKNASEALNFWEQAKAKEKSLSTLSDSLNTVPEIFPSVLKAQKLFKKALKAGLSADEQLVKARLNKAVEVKDYKTMLFLSVILCALDKKDAEVELNKLCADFKEKCKTKEKLEGVDIEQLLC